MTWSRKITTSSTSRTIPKDPWAPTIAMTAKAPAPGKETLVLSHFPRTASPPEFPTTIQTVTENFTGSHLPPPPPLVAKSDGFVYRE